MTPFGAARTAIDKSVGFDTDTALTAVSAMEFAAAGFTWCARYLSRGEELAADLEVEEVRALHMAGLSVIPVQHVHPAPWSPSADIGIVLGGEAAENAAGIGCPSNVVLWVDLEGVASGCPSAQIIGFCNEWTKAVEAAGFGSGVYVGANAGLTGSQLYHDLATKRYWRSLSGSAPVVAVRGFQIVQSFGGILAGTSYDRDVAGRDLMGDLPVLWGPR